MHNDTILLLGFIAAIATIIVAILGLIIGKLERIENELNRGKAKD